MFSFFLLYALSEDGPSALPETPGEDAEPHLQGGGSRCPVAAGGGRLALSHRCQENFWILFGHHC